MTSKSKQLENQETEIDYEDMLLKRFRIVSVIEEARKFNREQRCTNEVIQPKPKLRYGY